MLLSKYCKNSVCLSSAVLKNLSGKEQANGQVFLYLEALNQDRHIDKYQIEMHKKAQSIGLALATCPV